MNYLAHFTIYGLLAIAGASVPLKAWSSMTCDFGSEGKFKFDKAKEGYMASDLSPPFMQNLWLQILLSENEDILMSQDVDGVIFLFRFDANRAMQTRTMLMPQSIKFEGPFTGRCEGSL